MSMLRTVVLEASSHTQSKTVFRIPSQGHLIMPDIRLVNFGVSATQNGNGLESFAWSQGIFALIKSIRLYANNVLVDELKDASRVLCLEALKGNSSYCFDSKSVLLGTNVNLEPETYNGKSGLKYVAPKLLGRLSLEDVLSVCKTATSFNNWPKEIRVEVEYNTDKMVVFSNDGNGHAGNFSFTVSQPTCLYTEEMAEEVLKDLTQKGGSLMFQEWEREYIASVPQNVNNQIRVRAFDNKFVDSVVLQMIKDGQVDAYLGYGKSDVLAGQKVNWIVNGSKLLSFNGLDTAARCAGAMADYTQAMVVPFNGWDAQPANVSATANLGRVSAKLGWCPVYLQTVINRLDLEVLHTEVVPTDIWVWGRVVKFMSYDEMGNVVVGYMANPNKK